LAKVLNGDHHVLIALILIIIMVLVVRANEVILGDDNQKGQQVVE
jgi:hypothetical protein